MPVGLRRWGSSLLTSNHRSAAWLCEVGDPRGEGRFPCPSMARERVTPGYAFSSTHLTMPRSSAPTAYASPVMIGTGNAQNPQSDALTSSAISIESASVKPPAAVAQGIHPMLGPCRDGACPPTPGATPERGGGGATGGDVVGAGRSTIGGAGRCALTGGTAATAHQGQVLLCGG